MDRRFLRALALAGAACVAAAVPAGAVTVNPSFETGDTTGWNLVGDVTVVDSGFGVTPTDGTYQILITTSRVNGAVDTATVETAMGIPAGTVQNIFDTFVPSTGSGPIEGSAFQQTFFADAGDTLSFDWNFLTDEAVPEGLYTDFLWGTLELPSGALGRGALSHANRPLAEFSASSSSYDLETGYQTITLGLTQTGTYTLTLGVTDVEDIYVNSAGIFDNFLLTKIPEPDPLLLLAAGLLGLAWYSRHVRQAPRGSDQRASSATRDGSATSFVRSLLPTSWR